MISKLTKLLLAIKFIGHMSNFILLYQLILYFAAYLHIQDNSDKIIYMYFIIMVLEMKQTDNGNWWQGYKTTRIFTHTL